MFTNINLSNSEYIISIVLVLIAYFVSITINGVTQTWVADKMGDETPKQEGYDSLNPLVHIDFLGFFAIFLFRVGWGKFLPFNPDKIYRKNFNLRLALVYLSEPIISFLIALVSFIILIVTVEKSALQYIVQILFSYQILPLSIAKYALKDYSSLSILGILLLISFVILNTFITALSLIFNGVRYLVTLAIKKNGEVAQYTDILLIIGPLFIIWFYADPLRALVLKLMWYGANIFSGITGF